MSHPDPPRTGREGSADAPPPAPAPSPAWPELRDRLATSLRAAGIEVDVGEDDVRIAADRPDGFAVSLGGDAATGSLVLAFGELWNEPFDRAEEAVAWAVRGLTRDCRLVEIHRGERLVGARVEIPDPRAPERWRALATVRRPSLTFWRARAETPRSNDRLASEAARDLVASILIGR